MSIKTNKIYTIVFVLIATILSFNLNAETQQRESEANKTTALSSDTIKSNSIAESAIVEKTDSIATDSIAKKVAPPPQKKGWFR